MSSSSSRNHVYRKILTFINVFGDSGKYSGTIKLSRKAENMIYTYCTLTDDLQVSGSR